MPLFNPIQMGEISTKRPHHVTTVAAAAEPTLSPQQAPPPAKRQKCGNSGVKLKPLIQTKFKPQPKQVGIPT